MRGKSWFGDGGEPKSYQSDDRHLFHSLYRDYSTECLRTDVSKWLYVL